MNFIYLHYVCVCLWAQPIAHMGWSEGNLWGLFSPFIISLPGIKLSLPGLVLGFLTSLVISPMLVTSKQKFFSELKINSQPCTTWSLDVCALTRVQILLIKGHKQCFFMWVQIFIAKCLETGKRRTSLSQYLEQQFLTYESLSFWVIKRLFHRGQLRQLKSAETVIKIHNIIKITVIK